MRSEQHLKSDELQEKIVMRGRNYQLWAALIMLVIGVAIAGFNQVSPIWIIVGTIAWAVSTLHVSFTATLGELYEINDQLAGRKDEFKGLLSGRRESA
jgi:predicted anti-sigma-YlaC factor YlaD